MKYFQKRNILLFTLGFLFAFSQGVSAQKLPKKAETKFTVYGNCGMCEKRIETALDLKGITFSDWDRNTKEVYIKYNPRIVSEDELHKLITAVGHDTNKMKADTTVYSKLPGCCLYRENPNTHSD
jgi:copper chaperone CopZ